MPISDFGHRQDTAALATGRAIREPLLLQEAQVETLDEKRARLRGELREAYRSWVLASEHAAWPAAPAAATGCTPHSRAKWVDYAAARQRLVAAYAEKRPMA